MEVPQADGSDAVGAQRRLPDARRNHEPVAPVRQRDADEAQGRRGRADSRRNQRDTPRLRARPEGRGRHAVDGAAARLAGLSGRGLPVAASDIRARRDNRMELLARLDILRPQGEALHARVDIHRGRPLRRLDARGRLRAPRRLLDGGARPNGLALPHDARLAVLPRDIRRRPDKRHHRLRDEPRRRMSRLHTRGLFGRHRAHNVPEPAEPPHHDMAQPLPARNSARRRICLRLLGARPVLRPQHSLWHGALQRHMGDYCRRAASALGEHLRRNLAAAPA